MSPRLSREEQRAQTRARLLEAASDVFAQHGVNGASVEQIAERAGYSRGALYSNFADKHELARALLEERVRREHAEVRALADAGGSYAAAVDAMRAWHRERARHLDSWLTLRAELWLYAMRHPESRSAVAASDRFTRAAIAEGLRREFELAGVEAPAPLAQLAAIVQAVGDGLLAQRAIAPEDIAEDVAVDAVVLLLRGWLALAREASS